MIEANPLFPPPLLAIKTNRDTAAYEHAITVAAIWYLRNKKSAIINSESLNPISPNKLAKMMKNLHKGRLVFPLSSNKNVNRWEIGQELDGDKLSLLIQPHEDDSNKSKQKGWKSQKQFTTIHSPLHFVLHF